MILLKIIYKPKQQFLKLIKKINKLTTYND